jgi:hypothetical protein
MREAAPRGAVFFSVTADKEGAGRHNVSKQIQESFG